jgi:hypothetical protein
MTPDTSALCSFGGPFVAVVLFYIWASRRKWATTGSRVYLAMAALCLAMGLSLAVGANAHPASSSHSIKTQGLYHSLSVVKAGGATASWVDAKSSDQVGGSAEVLFLSLRMSATATTTRPISATLVPAGFEQAVASAILTRHLPVSSSVPGAIAEPWRSTNDPYDRGPRQFTSLVFATLGYFCLMGCLAAMAKERRAERARARDRAAGLIVLDPKKANAMARGAMRVLP